MSVRTTTKTSLKFYEKGTFIQRDSDADTYPRHPWCVTWTAKELASSADEFQYEENYLRGPEYTYIRPWNCYAQYNLHRPLDPTYLGLLGRTQGDTICTMSYVDEPINAIAVSMGVPQYLPQVYPTPAVNYQIDLRAYVNWGWGQTAWHDNVCRPAGGWPMLMWPPDECWTDDDVYHEKTSAYNGRWSGLISRFNLPPNPQFAVALFRAEPWKFAASATDYLPATDIFYGGSLWIRVHANGKINVSQLWEYNGIEQWIPLQEIRGGSVGHNGIDGAKDTGHTAFTVITTAHGVAISETGMAGHVMYWQRPGQLVDGRIPTSAEWPQGEPSWIPSARIMLRSNVGHWGFQVFPLSPATGMYNDTITGDPMLAPAALRGPLLRTPCDWYGYGEMFTALSFERPAAGAAHVAVIRVAPLCEEATNDNVNPGWNLPWTVPFKSADHCMQPILEMAAAGWTSTFTAPPLSWMQQQFPNCDDDFYAVDGLCGNTIAIDFFATPLLHQFTVGQINESVVVAGAPEASADVTALQLKEWELEYRLDEPDDSGSLVLNNRTDASGPVGQNAELTAWLAETSRRRVSLEAWNTNDAEEELERAWLFKGEAELPEGLNDSTIVTANLVTDVSRLLQGDIDGRANFPGDGQNTHDYLKILFAAAGLAPEQYEDTIEDLGVVGLDGPNWGPGRLNRGAADKPLWVPTAGQSWWRWIQEVLEYAADAGMWIDHSGTAVHEAVPTVKVGCRWCHSLQRKTPDTGIDADSWFWNHLEGPASPGCLAFDKIRSGDATDGVDWHLHTRAATKHTSMAADGVRQFVLGYRPVRRNPLDDFFNRIVVKGPRHREKGAADQMALVAELRASIMGLVTADMPLGYVREKSYTKDWITDLETANRVLLQLYYRHTVTPRYVEVTIPLLPLARCSYVFALHGGERADLDHTKWRITAVKHNGRPLTRESSTTLTGIYIGDLA